MIFLWDAAFRYMKANGFAYIYKIGMAFANIESVTDNCDYNE